MRPRPPPPSASYRVKWQTGTLELQPSQSWRRAKQSLPGLQPRSRSYFLANLAFAIAQCATAARLHSGPRDSVKLCKLFKKLCFT